MLCGSPNPRRSCSQPDIPHVLDLNDAASATSLPLAGKKRLGIDTGWNHGLEGQSASRTQSVRDVGKVANQTWMGIVSDQEPTAITGLFALGIG